MSFDDFLALAKKRKTTYEFTDTPVLEEDLTKIVKAGKWAPSHANSQPWTFIIIRNREVIRRVMPHVTFGEFHTTPPILIVVVLDHMIAQTLERQEVILNVADPNICGGMAALQMCLQATDLGISSCLLTPDSDVAGFLNVPKGCSLCVIIGLGYEKGGAPQRKRERKPLKELVLFEKFEQPKKSSVD